jgi:hypothetical protein
MNFNKVLIILEEKQSKYKVKYDKDLEYYLITLNAKNIYRGIKNKEDAEKKCAELNNKINQ